MRIIRDQCLEDRAKLADLKEFRRVSGLQKLRRPVGKVVRRHHEGGRLDPLVEQPVLLTAQEIPLVLQALAAAPVAVDALIEGVVKLLIREQPEDVPRGMILEEPLPEIIRLSVLYAGSKAPDVLQAVVARSRRFIVPMPLKEIPQIDDTGVDQDREGSGIFVPVFIKEGKIVPPGKALILRQHGAVPLGGGIRLSFQLISEELIVLYVGQVLCEQIPAAVQRIKAIIEAVIPVAQPDHRLRADDLQADTDRHPQTGIALELNLEAGISARQPMDVIQRARLLRFRRVEHSLHKRRRQALRRDGVGG